MRRLGIARPSPTPCRVCSRLCVFRNHPHKRGAAPESGAAGCCPAPAQQPPSRGGCCPAAGQQPPRSPRSNRPPEAGAALRSRGIRPPELQEPLPRKAGAVRGSPTAPAVAAPGTVAGAARDRRLLLRQPRGSCLGRAAFCPAPASGGRLLPSSCLGKAAPASGGRLLPREDLETRSRQPGRSIRSVTGQEPFAEAGAAGRSRSGTAAPVRPRGGCCPASYAV